MARIVITGAKGQLGRSLMDAASRFSVHELYGYDIDQLDITDTQVLHQMAKETGATVLINCAAYTAVDQAEQEEEKAMAINRDAVTGLVEVCSQLKINLIHISTDYVFDGEAKTPYREEDRPNPLSVYGASKWAGERVALSYRKGVVVRTSWLYTVTGNNFISAILRLGVEKEELRVVTDQISTPTYGPHLAQALLTMVEQIEASKTPDSLMGLYHFANRGFCSRFKFAKKIKEYSGFKADIKPISSLDYPTPAQRPTWSVLDTNKIKTTFGIVPNDWEDGLQDYFNQLNNN
ncbi:MAG: dTDP-4-dehydrorhamnose reductase [Prevotellaceae bacterium]|jgi:dTDP-4-dehydrorhamnose reductase|nr:dTDP-4-dehydrorhamnose reductase [Prevotellaceae bacterium]